VFYLEHYASTPSLTFWKLLRILHSTEFVWLVLGDDNRVKDALELRNEFVFKGKKPKIVRATTGNSCSVLELLIAFARRAEFMTDTRAKQWFWEFMTNLGLSEFTDAADFDPADVEEILDMFIWRYYDRNGNGGLLPIINPVSDQRDLELWYQFSAYLVDQHRMP
jgi:hypothetical protein